MFLEGLFRRRIGSREFQCPCGLLSKVSAYISVSVYGVTPRVRAASTVGRGEGFVVLGRKLVL